jgi:hypothetical protein
MSPKQSHLNQRKEKQKKRIIKTKAHVIIATFANSFP